jgi:HlyD family secretion protein
VVAIDEKNLRLIALGRKALVSVDAYPQRKFNAELIYINPGVNAQTGAVEVKLDIAQPPNMLRQDMTVSVDIEVARRTQVLLLAASAVHDADSAESWVMQVRAGRAVKTPVRLGLRSGGRVEMLQGLAEGDQVIAAVTPALAVRPGARVRVKSP